MPLTDQKIKALKSDPMKTLKFFDGGGLYFEVPPAGNKRWRLKYRFCDSGVHKEKLISLGTYPLISLKEARNKRDEAKRLLANGIDPSAKRQAERQAATAHLTETFEYVAGQWLKEYEEDNTSGHVRTVQLRLKNDVFPFIGRQRISAISGTELLQLLRRIESRGARETAHRVRTHLGQIFRFAMTDENARWQSLTSDPTTALRDRLKSVTSKNLAAVTDPARFGQILRMLDGYQGGPVTSSALLLAPLVFVRPGELRHAEWKDIDFDSAEWRFIATKTKTPHIVPMSHQAVTILRDLHPLTGRGRFVFPSPRTLDRPMSENAVLAALRSLGIPKEEMCGHGFRATARTLLDEVLRFPPHLIEHQLAHNVRDPLGTAYNRTTHLPERKAMMQRWADYLNKLKELQT